MDKAFGTVEDVSTKTVYTKRGPAPTYSFKVNGQWFKAGFKNPYVNVGDQLDIEYETGPYGAEAKRITKATAAMPPTPVNPSAPAVKSYRNGSFPIDPLDGQRSIIRQNALTNAREFVMGAVLETVLKDSRTVDAAADEIIRIARKFEAYTAGDMDLEAVKAELEQSTKE